jgi:hypothetical protein
MKNCDSETKVACKAAAAIRAVSPAERLSEEQLENIREVLQVYAKDIDHMYCLDDLSGALSPGSFSLDTVHIGGSIIFRDGSALILGPELRVVEQPYIPGDQSLRQQRRAAGVGTP